MFLPEPNKGCNLGNVASYHRTYCKTILVSWHVVSDWLYLIPEIVKVSDAFP
jgi:hypothetical protein